MLAIYYQSFPIIKIERVCLCLYSILGLFWKIIGIKQKLVPDPGDTTVAVINYGIQFYHFVKFRVLGKNSEQKGVSFEDLVNVILENLGYTRIRRDPQATGMESDLKGMTMEECRS